MDLALFLSGNDKLNRYFQCLFLFVRGVGRTKTVTYVSKVKTSFGLTIPLSHSPQNEGSEIENFKTEITETNSRLDCEHILMIAFQ